MGALAVLPVVVVAGVRLQMALRPVLVVLVAQAKFVFTHGD
jgi:hypothetical protein